MLLPWLSLAMAETYAFLTILDSSYDFAFRKRQDRENLG